MPNRELLIKARAIRKDYPILWLQLSAHISAPEVVCMIMGWSYSKFLDKKIKETEDWPLNRQEYGELARYYAKQRSAIKVEVQRFRK